LKAHLVALAVAIGLAAWGCGGGPQGIRDASPDEITIASEPVSIGEYAAKYFTLEKHEVETSPDAFTVKVSLKVTKDVPWQTVYVLYDVKNRTGKSTPMVTSSNLAVLKGPLAAGTVTEVTLTVPRDKPAGERSIVIMEITKINPAG